MERNLEKWLRTFRFSFPLAWTASSRIARSPARKWGVSAIQNFVAPSCAIVSRHRVIVLHQNRVATFGDDLVYFLSPVETMNLEHLRTGWSGINLTGLRRSAAHLSTTSRLPRLFMAGCLERQWLHGQELHSSLHFSWHEWPQSKVVEHGKEQSGLMRNPEEDCDSRNIWKLFSWPKQANWTRHVPRTGAERVHGIRYLLSFFK